MRHFLLFYDFASDYQGRRADYREQHLAQAWPASERGELILAGALTEPLDTGVLLFKAESAATAEEFASSDPYVINGLVVAWRVREWVTAVGEDSTSPVGKPSNLEGSLTNSRFETLSAGGDQTPTAVSEMRK